MVGKIVQHARYGQGVVRTYEAPYMQVYFESEHMEKRFAYPQAFERFLRFEDSEAQAQADNAIAVIQAEQNRKQEAYSLAVRQREAAMAEARKAELKAKRAAAAKKAAGTRAANRQARKA